MQIQVALTVLNEVITAAREGGMGDRGVGSFLAFAVEVIEAWGYRYAHFHQMARAAVQVPTDLLTCL